MTMILMARTVDGLTAAVKCELPPTAEDLRRLSGKPGSDVR